MAANLNFPQLLHEYATLHGIPDIKLQEGNNIALSSSEVDLNIAYLEDTNDLVVVSYLGYVEEDQRESVLYEPAIFNPVVQMTASKQPVYLAQLPATFQG